MRIHLRTILFLALLSLAGPLWSQTPVTITIDDREQVAEIDERFSSYNVEMAEVVGGDFWIPYDQMDTTQTSDITAAGEVGENKNRYRYRSPVDLSNLRLRTLAEALSPAFMRVSGSWANYVYFQDNDSAKLEKAPEGFKNVLTREEWRGVLDFAEATGADLMTSFAISPGTRDEDGRWTPEQARLLLDFTKQAGGTIEAVQFFNEPNMPEYAGAPKGYTAQDFAQDVAVFTDFIHEALPDVPIAGPDAVGEGGLMPAGMNMPLSTDALLSASPKPDFDIFAYHHYGGVSLRCAQAPPMHSPVDSALTDNWLHKTLGTYAFYKKEHDRHLPETPIWLTETAEAACGGNPWAAEYIDVFRYLSQMGLLAREDVKIIMHNTLTASEYGILDQATHTPRPNYWAALLWRQLMGTRVYDPGVDGGRLGVYLHSHRDNPDGKTLLLINPTDAPITVDLPAASRAFVLTSDDLRSKTVYLNGEELTLTANDQLPEITGKPAAAGAVELPAYGVGFYVFSDN
ncbi:hypothetical protein GGR28_000621 [Lewinella aquimaris]|uniref:D-apionate lactonase C-terminal domain-containing protein n=1 Tax=Neolewinella aquimaris TaxID=1835722 RepID=A0A840DYP3_9BACT|nr:hypothetical protein [Neolewinella aquimaris]MBB4078020.1 hypothetical protein [Neolewinella aquimaris]